MRHDALATPSAATPAAPDRPRAVPPSAPPAVEGAPTPRGTLVGEGVEQAYRLDHYDRMAPFLMSVVSDSDLWMFLSSTGSLTAGRRRPEMCIFSYETDDRLHVGAAHSGPITLIRVATPGAAGSELWAPFEGVRHPRAERTLRKGVLGGFVEFEERRLDLGLSIRARWAPASRFGFVRTVTLALDPGAPPLSLEILDGLRGVMPAGVDLLIQQRASTLADAFKRSELDPETGLGIYALEARIGDRPEPSESLRANVVWSAGFEPDTILMGSSQIGAFRDGATPAPEPLATGERGAYLLVGTRSLEPGASVAWDIVADAHLAQESVVALRRTLRREPDIRRTLRREIDRGAAVLGALVAEADGFQATADRAAVAHHRSNVLFNAMRGGVFVDGYSIASADLRAFIGHRNADAAQRQRGFLEGLPASISHDELISQAGATEDADLIRLCHEYLPLTFSRRHGDPSRPWNMFDIRVEGPGGEKLLNYEGNWRDIFQNWEALCESYPWFVESVVAKFVNASTVDGFNPYRIGRDGIGWEENDPGDPWSNIGYWGDHQIIYLLRLLESSRRHRPSALRALLHRRIFSYADVPYRIRPYEALLASPKSTIEYDDAHAARVEERVSRVGTDGRLVHDRDDRVHHVSLIEKLLVPALSKISSTVPDAGVWLNTQRPEWNDANNALAGCGVSMVTLFHLRRYLSFLIDLLRGEDELPIELSAEVAEWFDQVLTILTESLDALERPEITARDRKTILDRLGRSFSDYRQRVYRQAFSHWEERPIRAITDFCRIARHHVDHAIEANRRPDGLFHSYNLWTLSGEGETEAQRPAMEIERLPEMLEGQVAAVNSGALSPGEVLSLIDALFAGPLYRPDQKSFILYPEARRPSYLDRNVLAPERVRSIPLLSALVEAGDTTVIVRDTEGDYRFSSDFRSTHDLRRALARLEGLGGLTEMIRADGRDVHALFEEVFRHHAFTGRAGAMYKYEGLGCVYWHMVSKLLLAIQESYLEFGDRGERPETLDRLARAYYEVRAGLGFNKTPGEHGAIPIDPYSHTPRHIGAQQPGMTGQVKEGIIIRLGELGVRVIDGKLRFRPRLLRASEFFDEATTWRLPARDGAEATSIELPPGSLGFTLCATPIIYRLTDAHASIESVMTGGRLRRVDGATLDEGPSAELFGRTGRVSRIEVHVPRDVLLGDAGER